MSSSTSSEKDENNSAAKNDNKVEKQNTELKRGSEISYPNYYDEFFETFKQNIQNMANFMERSWSSTMPFGLRTSSPYELFKGIAETRMPLCDVIDRGDKYEINLEIPGISKENIDLKATKNSLRVSAVQTEKTKERDRKYIYSERSYKSFHRQIPFAEEIVPSNISANVKNGMLEITVPKKTPTKLEGNEEFRVDVS
ncbi:MAG: Hsp20/alpha crystallin family protein [Candidatus Nitrosocosmicus sp.]|jgi:HSP20 family protein